MSISQGYSIATVYHTNIDVYIYIAIYRYSYVVYTILIPNHLTQVSLRENMDSPVQPVANNAGRSKTDSPHLWTLLVFACQLLSNALSTLALGLVRASML